MHVFDISEHSSVDKRMSYHVKGNSIKSKINILRRRFTYYRTNTNLFRRKFILLRFRTNQIL